MTGDRPRATYRLQFGPTLHFAAAADLVEYLAALGITHVYCSPVLQARAGSEHGYDVVDPTRLSEGLGGDAGFRRLVEAAGEAGLRLLIDVVPNHVGTGSDNPLWDALLAEGPAGSAAAYFDVDWTPALPGAAGKVIVPVLGHPYGVTLTAGDLVVDTSKDAPRLRYHEHSFPLSYQSRAAYARDDTPPPLAGIPGRSGSWGRLHALLEAQHYRLVHWRAGDALVNYRRFFAINELAAVRVEDPAVFEHTHARLLELLASRAVDGLRIDHIDGLTDPGGYLARLRSAAGAGAWIVVEKILAPDEQLPDWPVAGTTGYDFLADVCGLFVDPSAEKVLTDLAVAEHAWPRDGDLEHETARAKRECLEQDLAADTERLVDRFWEVTQHHLDIRDVTRAACRGALLAALVALDVYRVYTSADTEASADEVARVRRALARAREQEGAVPAFLWEFLERFLCGRVTDTALHTETLRRFHQVSSAAVAKGVEDTLLYRQHRLAALNDVGVEPERFGVTVAAFHAANQTRAERHPEGMLTTSTHDTKRGEDVRLRIAALSEVADLWQETVTRWRERHRDLVAGGIPDPATAYLCYQTLVGVWPPHGEPDLADLRGRVQAYIVKAAREDGRRTSWVEPDEAYERALRAFVDRLLDPRGSAAFLDELRAITRRTGEIAMTSGLAQLVLRSTGPGAPDTYQGLELWGDNLVDPDNRRPVDFAERRRLLETLDREPVDLGELVAHRADGRIKLWVLSRALRARAAHPRCFGPAGGYEQLTVAGRFADHVVAYARTAPDGEAALVIAPRLVGAVIGDAGGPPLGSLWHDTRVALPDAFAGRRWRDVLSGRDAQGRNALPLADALARLPVAVLVG